MADANDVRAENADKGGGVSMTALMLVIPVAVFISVAGLGGAGYWLLKSGRLPSGGPAKVQAAEVAEPAKSKLVALDPLLVNLADAGGHAYLRIGMVLREEELPVKKDAPAKDGKDEKPEKGKVAINESDVIVRDAALDVAGHQTSDTLLAGDGKERLKEELKKAMQTRLPEARIVDVMFTEFLVQR